MDRSTAASGPGLVAGAPAASEPLDPATLPEVGYHAPPRRSAAAGTAGNSGRPITGGDGSSADAARPSSLGSRR